MSPFALLESAFDPAQPRAALELLPERPAVFALYAADKRAEPYIGRTPNLRARLERLLIPSPRHPKRLQLASLVRAIRWRSVGSEFEALLRQFDLLESVYGPKALERMHLRMPTFLRLLKSDPFPRFAVTNRPTKSDLGSLYGPFPSRAAAERFLDELLKLFPLRRCAETLSPSPGHPGCIYSEMKKCLAPCCLGSSAERYALEVLAAERFLTSRGQSRLEILQARRERASETLDFELAAQIHAQIQKMDSVLALLPEIARPLSRLRALIVQPGAEPATAAIFLYEGCSLRGPALAEIPDGGPQSADEECGNAAPEAQLLTKEQRKQREAQLESALNSLAEQFSTEKPSCREGHMTLLKRWFYRPESRRSGEILFLQPGEPWPTKALLRAAGRVAQSAPAR